MKPNLNRRDFLKLASLLPLGAAASHLAPALRRPLLQDPTSKNVIVVVFDAFSAYDVSVYGFQRATTPNLARLSKRALVYHNHFAGGCFTSPGTASLLTGVLPWTHRALLSNSEVAEPYITRNIFEAFEKYYRIAYTHNGWAYTLLRQFRHSIDELIAREKLLMGSLDAAIGQLLPNDADIASVSWIRDMRIQESGYAYSLVLSRLLQALEEKRAGDFKPLFPRGLPTTGSDNGFLLETAVNTIAGRLLEIPQPFLGYFHFLPPHYPYRTSREFYNAFKDDGFKSIEKPTDLLVKNLSKNLPAKRTEYDEFILYCDDEFGRLYQQLESSGLLENSWLVLTSDHGEMFERGISGHSTDTLYQPLVRVPLMIFEPGRKTGMDIFDYTSGVDVLPTLAYVTGQKAPNWSEGTVLPPFAPGAMPPRNVYIPQARENEKYGPLTQASIMLVREDYKLHYYFGYPQVPSGGLVRLFNLKSDPEEMSDLAQAKPGVTDELLHELKSRLTEVDQPYM